MRDQKTGAYGFIDFMNWAPVGTERVVFTTFDELGRPAAKVLDEYGGPEVARYTASVVSALSELVDDRRVYRLQAGLFAIVGEHQVGDHWSHVYRDLRAEFQVGRLTLSHQTNPA